MQSRPLFSTIAWPGMRSEYASLPPHTGVTVTKPGQIGMSFSRHNSLVRTVDGRSTRSDVTPGAVFVTGAEAITWSEVRDWTEALEIYPDPELLRSHDAGADVDLDRPVATTVDARDGVLVGVAHLLRRAHLTGGGLTDVAASTLAHGLVAHIAQVYGHGRKPVPVAPGRLDHRLVDRVTQFVEAHVGEELSLGRLAAVVAMSPFHFARAFRASTGLTPHQFVTARRIEAARGLLLRTDAGVPAIAMAVGFSNVSHFRRLFRRELGVLPGQLRARPQDPTLPAAQERAIVQP